ncbi:hypothetical protein E4U57_003664 [Claviceps arundinis]|uniref:Nucleolar 27S pre-rRNA processing Urb2/Npa2 C-terminal domain-containing protein n=1 Tax=Claviceps arundinis TaxID=1623583 RepID=A0ABQ7P6B6_9HYPO|nr:hypothetical protein E4U57_003664 [Claviceps arundinis]
MQNNTDLIKTVRGLDQNGPGENGENLQVLWNLLVASPYNGFHAAEESSLRWLLKSMHGSADAAETLRRYPITWTILDCVFQRIPLFSLAKSLADRKFVSVLQHTLEDVAKPTKTATSPPSSKRKRSTTQSFSIQFLRSQEGCLSTAEALFTALKRLLDRLDSTTERFSRDKLGAEHIKSLFCTSAEAAKDIAAPALRICRDLLASDVCDQTTDCESWVRVVTTIWDFHLQGPDDVMQVAEHIFEPAAVISAKFGAFKASGQTIVLGSLKASWLSDLQRFMYHNFALPGRAAFVNSQDLVAFQTALQSCNDMAYLAVPALYFFASTAYQDMAKGGLRKSNAEWIKQIFQISERAIRGRPDRNSIMQSVLEQAIERSSPVSVVDLRRICQEYCLQDNHTQWSLVAKIAQCETDVFQLSDDGMRLRKEVCERIAKDAHNQDDTAAIEDIIQAMRDGFRTRRDLTGFLRLWFEQLCEIENRKLEQTSPWFKILRGQRSNKNSLRDALEIEMSPQHLGELIAWVKEKLSASNPQALSVFASTIAQSLHSEQYVNTAGRQLFDLVDGFKASSSYCALRWRVVSATVSWIDPSERGDMWDKVKKRLTRTAGKSALLTAESYEAFKCCCRFWDLFSPDEAHVEEPAALFEVWMKRLSADIASVRVHEETKMTASISQSVDAEFDEQIGYQQYLGWMLNASSRLSKLHFARAKTLPPALEDALSSEKSSADGITILCNALLGNEVNLSEANLTKHLTDRIIAALEESQKRHKEKDWPSESGQMWMQILSSMPMDALDRSQRENIMMVLAKRPSHACDPSTDVQLTRWKMILSLSAKIMKRPTFYDDLQFLDLVACSEALSSFSWSHHASHSLVLELIERFSLMATAVLKQMADHVDERSVKYFQGASTFVNNCEKQSGKLEADDHSRPAFHMTLLKALALELSRSANARSNSSLLSLLTQTQQALSKCIIDVISSCASEKKLLDSHNTVFNPLILTAIDAASAASDLSGLTGLKSSSVRKLEKRIKAAMQSGDLRAWKMHMFLQRNLSTAMEDAQPSVFDNLDNIPNGLGETLLKELIDSITSKMDAPSKFGYLRRLMDGFKTGCSTDGQLVAIEHVANQLMASPDFLLQTEEGFNLSMVHSELTSMLLKQFAHPHIICRILRNLLEKRPQCMSQWNIEVTLSTVSNLVCLESSDAKAPSYSWLCKLVEVIIKKHRIRLEGHFHLVLSTMQILLQSLVTRHSEPSSITKAAATSGGSVAVAVTVPQEAHAHVYARLVTLICEPTAGAVSRSQLHSSLDSATDAAKRSAGRHMYLLLVQYVKLQLEANVSTQVREALEPAMNSIFDITPPEGRKILNDVMDASGRAILKEMYRRYVKFGKWSGV